MRNLNRSIDLRELIYVSHGTPSIIVNDICLGKKSDRSHSLNKSLTLHSYIDSDDLGYLSDELSIEDRLVLTKGVFMRSHFLYRFESWSCVLTSSEDKKLCNDLDECTSWNKLCHYYLGRIIGVKEYKERLYNITFKVLSGFINKALYTDHDGNMSGSPWNWNRPVSILQTALNLFSICKLDRDKLLYDIKLSSFSNDIRMNQEISLFIYVLQVANWKLENISEILYNFKERQWGCRWIRLEPSYRYSLDKSLHLCTRSEDLAYYTKDYFQD